MSAFGRNLRSGLVVALHLVLVLGFIVASIAPVFAAALQTRLNEIPERVEEEHGRTHLTPEIRASRKQSEADVVLHYPPPTAPRSRLEQARPVAPAQVTGLLSIPLRC